MCSFPQESMSGQVWGKVQKNKKTAGEFCPEVQLVLQIQNVSAWIALKTNTEMSDLDFQHPHGNQRIQ